MYVGLDVHSKKTSYVVQDREGKVVGEGAVVTNIEGMENLVRKRGLPAGTAVGLECGAQAAVVCDALADLGMIPRVINAAEVRRKARRIGQKTDQRDAFEICDGLRRDIWDSIVYMPPPEIRLLRRILSRRGHFVRMSGGQINAAKFLLRAEALLIGKPVSLTTVGGWEKLMAREEVQPVLGHLELHAKSWRMAKDHIELLETELAEAIKPVGEVVELLMSTPGVGLITASTYVATLGTPERFADSNHVVSYLGLAPSMYDSGEMERHGRITKAGSSQMRALLCEVAQQAARHYHPLQPYFRRIAAKSGYKKAAIAIAQRLARIMYRMWKNGERFDATKLNVERDGRERKRTYQWRIKPDQIAAIA
jgi:transposase